MNRVIEWICFDKELICVFFRTELIKLPINSSLKYLIKDFLKQVFKRVRIYVIFFVSKENKNKRSQQKKVYNTYINMHS